MKLKYSTPSKYFEAIKSLNKTWPVRREDYFPYNEEIKKKENK
jgi:hypothetical protein